MTGPRLPFRQMGSVAYRAIAGRVEHNDANMGAALAFYTMFAIAPILVIAVAVAGYAFGPQVAETQVLEQLSALIGDTGAVRGHRQTRQALADAAVPDLQGQGGDLPGRLRGLADLTAPCGEAGGEGARQPLRALVQRVPVDGARTAVFVNPKFRKHQRAAVRILARRTAASLSVIVFGIKTL